MNYTDRIKPDNKGLTTYLDELRSMNYQIPTFQRDVVWEAINVKKLWDSIYKFYPLGSILIWKTDVKLHNHREIGGHVISDQNFNKSEYQYILDGQQRTTSLLTSLYGGKIESRPDFDPTLYVDLTISLENDTDDESYKYRFLFWEDIDDKNGQIRQNIGKKKRFDSGLIVKLIDIKERFNDIQNQVFDSGDVNHDFRHPYMEELKKLKAVLDNYRISFIEIKGIETSEVCQIFERINQAGKPLDIFDIVVAKTYKQPTDQNHGFYLREIIETFKQTNKSAFLALNDLDYLQILAVLIKQYVKNNSVHNITPRYLNEIKTEQLVEVWPDAQKAMLKTFDFFENHLHIPTPYFVPYRYFYLSIAVYFFQNTRPNYKYLEQYFWFYSFHNDDLLSNTTQLFAQTEALLAEKSSGNVQFDDFVIDKKALRMSSYSSKGRMSRAILALFASAEPKDWKYCNRSVIVPNSFFGTDNLNLHHVFPTNSDWVLENESKNKITNNSLMDIVFLPQITNLEISNKNPVDYIKDYDKPEFKTILSSHYLSDELIAWSRQGVLPGNALDTFIETRVNNIINDLKVKLNGIPFQEIDTGYV